MADLSLEELDGPRACGPLELSGVLDLTNLVMRTLNAPEGGPPRHPSIGFDYPHVFNGQNLDNIRVFTHRGRVVCALGIYPSVVRTPGGDLSVGGICCLATHPEYRRYGLGTRVMEDAHRQMRESGHQVGILSTNIQDYYRKLGWESAGRQRTFTFDRGNIAVLPEPDGLEVTEDWRSLVEDLNALYLAGPVGARRDAGRFGLLMERKAGRVFAALRGERPVAYAVVRGTLVSEYAGAFAEVAPLLRAVFGVLDDPGASTSRRPPGQRATVEMRVQTPDAADGLPAFLVQQGVPHTFGYLGMLKILDPAGLFGALRVPGVEVAAAGDRWRVSYGGKTAEFGERGLVRLVFGPERVEEFAPEGFPVSFYQWPADRV